MAVPRRAIFFRSVEILINSYYARGFFLFSGIFIPSDNVSRPVNGRIPFEWSSSLAITSRLESRRGVFSRLMENLPDRGTAEEREIRCHPWEICIHRRFVSLRPSFIFAAARRSTRCDQLVDVANTSHLPNFVLSGHPTSYYESFHNNTETRR